MNQNTIAGGVILLFALAYTIMAFYIPPSSFKTAAVGPRAFPIAIGVLLAFTSFILFIKGLMEARNEAVKPKPQFQAEAMETEEKENEEKQDPKKLGLMAVLLLGYVLLFFPLGYVVSTGLFILCTTMILDRKHWIRNLLYAVLFPFAVHLLFNELLKVQLPAGPFG